MKKKALNISNLSKKYSTNIVLNNINITFYENEVIGLIGKNGVGKTTFIKSCVDLLNAKGKISYYGKSLKDLNKNEKVKLFTVLLEGRRNIYWKLTVVENIKYFIELRGSSFTKLQEFILFLLKELSIYDKRNILVEDLSSGMKQKVALIIALAMDTPIIFLDEPTIGLDYESKLQVIQLLNNPKFKNNKLVIASSHDFNFIDKISSRTILLKEGIFIEKENDIEYFYHIFVKNKKIPPSILEHSKVIEYRENLLKIIVLNKKLLSEIIKTLINSKVEILSVINTKYNTENLYLS